MEKQKTRLSPMIMGIVFTLFSIFSILAMCPNTVLAEVPSGITFISPNALYANGNPITLKGSPSDADNTQVFLGSSTTPEVLAGLTADSSGGYNLKSCYIHGGSNVDSVSSTSITMLGGKVNSIYGGGSKPVNGSTNVTISGGEIAYDVYGGGASVEVIGATNVTINGGIMGTVYGGGSSSNSAVGSANVIINSGTITKGVYAGGRQAGMGGLSVNNHALIRIGADASVSGIIKADANGGWSLNTRSVQYEVAFYDGMMKLTVPESQWVEMGIGFGNIPTNGTATEPVEVPTGEGKTFTGWKDANGDEYTFPKTITNPQKVYASWEYTAVYKDNGKTGGDVPADSTKYLAGDTVTLLSNSANLTKTSYTFGGWSTTPGGTPITSYTIHSAAPVFYAVWNPIPTYAVTYNGNGNTSGIVPTDSTKYLAGANVPLAGNTGSLTKTGYTFDGWSTTANGTAVTTCMMGSAPVTFYAVWKVTSADNNTTTSGDTYTSATTTSRAPSLETGTGQTIYEALKAAPTGGTVEVNMNDSTMLQDEWLKAISGKDVNLVLDMGNGIKWTINGKSVTGTSFSSLNLGVSTNSSVIPTGALNTLAGNRKAAQFTVTHSGNFGFTATLSMGLGKENKGLFANLYYYNETTKKFEFQDAYKIAEDGFIGMGLTHTSSYAIVIDKVSLASELSAGASAEDTVITLDTVNRQWGFAALIAVISAVFVLGALQIQARKAK